MANLTVLIGGIDRLKLIGAWNMAATTDLLSVLIRRGQGGGLTGPAISCNQWIIALLRCWIWYGRCVIDADGLTRPESVGSNWPVDWTQTPTGDWWNHQSGSTEGAATVVWGVASQVWLSRVFIWLNFEWESKKSGREREKERKRERERKKGNERLGQVERKWTDNKRKQGSRMWWEQ